MANYYTQFSFEVSAPSEEAVTWLAEALATADADNENGGLGFEWENSTPVVLWIHTDENGDLEQLADIVGEYLQKFDPEKSVVVEWANTCSKPRTDGFSGGAMVVTAHRVHWMHTSEWVNTTLKALKQITGVT